MNVPVAVPQRREIQTVVDAVPILDTARFEHMQRVANVMAHSSMIPESLRTTGKGNDKEDLPFEQILSNCFLVVNQAARWGMDPFAVISCCAVVHGRLAYEGKLVSAVLAAKLNLSLHHYFTGDAGTDAYRIYLSDQPFTPDLIEQLKPGCKIPGFRLWDGSVGEWKTTGTGTPWVPKNYPRMLIYRGTRDWTRIYESALMLGVYSDDEMLDLVEDARARRATPVATLSLADRLLAAKTTGDATVEGFSQERVTRETGGDTEAQRNAADKTPPRASTGDEPLASDQGASADAPEEAHDRVSESASSPIPDSSEQPAPPQSDAQADEPAAKAVPASKAAGDHPSDPPSEVDGDEQAGNVSRSGVPSDLPEGWPISYASALRRAQKKDSLAKYASEFWKQYGGWDKIKLTDARETAGAIYDAFNKNFGNKDAIEADLREVI